MWILTLLSVPERQYHGCLAFTTTQYSIAFSAFGLKTGFNKSKHANTGQTINQEGEKALECAYQRIWASNTHMRKHSFLRNEYSQKVTDQLNL